MSRHVVTHAGHRLAYRIRGDGPPVVWIQGVGLHGDGWTPQIDALKSDFTCLSIDNRGMGGSDWDGRRFDVAELAGDIAAVMDAVGWGAAHIVGHSLGGLIAQHLVFKDRRRARSLSLLCTFAGGKGAAPLSPRLMWLGLRSRVGPRALRRRAFLKLLMSPAGYAAIKPDRRAKELAEIFGHDLADQPGVVGAQLRALRRAKVDPAALAKLAEIPTMVAAAVHDPIAPTRSGRALAKMIPNARYVEWGDASHGAPIEIAAHVNRVVRDHILAAENGRSRR